jgi:hypothetical protein
VGVASVASLLTSCGDPDRAETRPVESSRSPSSQDLDGGRGGRDASRGFEDFSTSTGTSGGDDDGTDDDAGADDSGGRDDGLVVRPPSPLEEAFGMLTSPDELSDVYGRAYRSHAEHTQQCIIDEGFAGFLVETWTIPSPDEFLVAGSTIDAIDRFGYGISGSLRAQLENLQRTEADRASTLNQGFLDSLSESDQTTFYETLDACTREAWDLYPLPDAFPAEVADELAEVQLRALADPEVVAAWDRWSICMADAGFDHRSRDDAVGGIQQMATQAQEAVMALGQVGDIPTEAEVAALEAEITEIERFERQVVDADVVCAEAAEVERHIHEAVTREEEAWLDENADRVALILADQPPRWWER